MNSAQRVGLRSFFPLAVLTLLAAPLAAQEAADGPANYRLAARFAPYRIDELIYSTSVDPQWIEGSESFWYEWETSDGSFYNIVDPVAGTKRQIFDNDRIAAELTRITRDPWDGQHLPIRAIKFIDANTLQFEVESSQDEEEEETESEMEELDQEEEEGEEQGQRARKKVFHFEYDVNMRTLREMEDWEAPDNHPSWASVSPDGQTVIFARHHNLYMMSGDDYQQFLEARRGKSGDEADEAEEELDVDETQLTTDGEEHYSYAVFERGDTDIERKENADERKRVSISWSHDSRRFSLIRRDRREVGDLWVIHMVGNKRPELESYKYDMPGEADVSQPQVLIYDLQDREMVEVTMPEEWKDHRLSQTSARQFRYPDSEEPFRALWLSPNSDELHFVRQSRDQHGVDVMVADAATGESRVLFEERLNTYVEFQRLELLESGDMLWWSERDGWAHLYRFGPDGSLRNRLTEGPWSVRRVVGIDESAGVVYFQANAREAGEDPYYQHLYRVNLNGSGLTLLNPGDLDHRAEMGESNRFFVNNHSRVEATPAAALHASTGRRIMDLETADFSKLEEAGYGFPEPYTVKADDGVTDLYGVMYKPFDFDPTKTYPVVAYVYPGPQTESVAKSFSTARYETALAQFGMVVITVGNRGGHPARSKWYHNYGYGNLRDYGLADKKAAIEQLADRHDFIDIDRVGIYGHSGGGFMSTAAMLVYPDFFKVAVSSSGNHNNDVYNQNWSEKHHGVREVVDDSGNVTFEYEIERNSDLAANLKGHLMLTTGDIDNNVHHAGTHRMAEALVRANKRFDYFVFPGQRHGYGDMSDYWFWLRAEYFVRHLLRDTRWSADITQLNVEREQAGGR
ncbi:DPP IV N-terminal domain-containing protein [Candidatus Palauibacter sp.]|uniref:S9 family peptidase n=1 Tax=Candidatus Palauibacter sp. TaxID=3101350 RepID=UPI003AF2FB17